MIADALSGSIDGLIKVAWYAFVVWFILKIVKNFKRGKAEGKDGNKGD